MSADVDNSSLLILKGVSFAQRLIVWIVSGFYVEKNRKQVEEIIKIF